MAIHQSEQPESTLAQLFARSLPVEGQETRVGDKILSRRGGALRLSKVGAQKGPAARDASAQNQTGDAFGFKWNRRDSYDSPAANAVSRAWLIERYGPPDALPELCPGPEPKIVLDAGCGSGLSASLLFGGALRDMRYVGVDISDAVEAAAARFAERGLPGEFLQADICDLPFPDRCVDVVFSEGVLHHTDDTRRALGAVARLVKTGGLLMFYVYRRKGPVREFTDDYVRARLRDMPPEAAWAALEPLTRLGCALGELNAEIDIQEPIEVLGVPAGRISVQRLFYWHVCKAFYHPDMSFDEMNHINFDWFAPRNAHRQTPEEVRRWCDEIGFEIIRENVQDAGVTIIARRMA